MKIINIFNERGKSLEEIMTDFFLYYYLNIQKNGEHNND